MNAASHLSLISHPSRRILVSSWYLTVNRRIDCTPVPIIIIIYHALLSTMTLAYCLRLWGVALILVAGLSSAKRTTTTTHPFPHPHHDPAACRVEGLVTTFTTTITTTTVPRLCDPDDVLSGSEKKQLQTKLTNLEAAMSIPCHQSSTSSRDKGGKVQMAVALEKSVRLFMTL